MALHIYHVLKIALREVLQPGPWFEEVFHYCMRIEFQGRGTVHIHIALWAIPLLFQDLTGRTDDYCPGDFVSYLSELFGGCKVDVQKGSGWLNYINGYVAKENDALDFRVTEHYGDKETNAPWRQTMRLMSKKAPLLTEVYLSMKKAPRMIRTFLTDVLCPVIPGKGWDPEKATRHHKIYEAYLATCAPIASSDASKADPTKKLGINRQPLSLIQYCRRMQWDGPNKRAKERTYTDSDKQVTAIGVQFQFELYDIFLGQWATTFFPHTSQSDFLFPVDRGAFKGTEWCKLDYTMHFVGVLSFLLRLEWYVAKADDPPILHKPHVKLMGPPLEEAVDDSAANTNYVLLLWESFPHVGRPQRPDAITPNQPVFEHSAEACNYFLRAVHNDLSMRFSEERCSTFKMHVFAKWSLLRGLSRTTDLQTQMKAWNDMPIKTVTEPPWSDDQKEVLKAINQRLNPEDVYEAYEGQNQPIYLGGDPGTGKSEVMIHAAYRGAEQGFKVLIMCPTGALVHAYRERLPTHHNIAVETIHSATVIIRAHDEVVKYSPPSRLRKYDLFIIDEASQIDDPIAERLRMAFAELPHHWLLIVAADYRQLQPMEGGRVMLNWCLEMKYYYLTQVHRTNDPALKEFLKTVRTQQPSRDYLLDFWRPRTMSRNLQVAVWESGLLQKRRGKHFMWLCVTNAGADRINRAALALCGVTESDLEKGYPGDPNCKAGKIFIKAGIWLRLTRNLDKARGFVNGALAQVLEVLAEDETGVSVFTAKLSTGALVLVHPIRAKGQTFLPCSYGYATTIRRAQGSSLDLGALYFDHKFPADRGYGYVGERDQNR